MGTTDRILILGGSHSELPLIQSAKRAGLKVVTTGNQPTHPGHQLSDFYLCGDFSDLDQMDDVFQRSGCRYVVSAANDYAYLTACRLAQRHALPGFDPADTALTLHHKHLFKPLAASLGMPTTRFKVIHKGRPTDWQSLDLHYPLIVKPVDLTGGKGMTVVRKPEQLYSALVHAGCMTRENELVIEEYFEGHLHSYSTIINNGEIIFEYADNEFCHPNPFLVSTSTSLASVPTHILSDIRHQTEKLANHLNLSDGVLHSQFLHNNSEYRILEYTRRCSGDLYSTVVEKVTGLKHADQFIRQSLGMKTELFFSEKKHSFVSRHCIFPEKPGKNNTLLIDPKILSYVVSVVNAWPADHEYTKIDSEKSSVAIILYPNLMTMTNLTSEIHNLIRFG